MRRTPSKLRNNRLASQSGRQRAIKPVVEGLECRRLMAFAFTEGPTYGTASGFGGTGDLTTGDIDHNGTPDIVFAQAVANQDYINVLLGDGRGSYPNRYHIQQETNVGAVELVDINRDGNLDLLTTGEQNGKVYLRFGNGDGSFAPAQSYQMLPIDANAGVTDLKVADFNNDGHLDLAGAGYGWGVATMQGTGNFSAGAAFTPHATITAIGGPFDIAIADTNFDDRPDIFAAAQADGPVGIAIVDLHLPTPRVEAMDLGTQHGMRPRRVAAANDAAGNFVFAVSAFGDPFSSGGTGTILQGIRLRQNGQLTSATTGGLRSTTAPVVADFDADGRLDMAYASSLGSNVFQVTVSAGVTGTGLPFQMPSNSTIFTMPNFLYNIAVGHVNSDGVPDLILAKHIGVSGFLNHQSSLVVNTLADENDGNSRWDSGSGASLREVIEYASTLPGPQSITFAPSLTGTIQLGSQVSIPSGKNISIHDDSAATPITLSGRGLNRVINADPFSTLSLRNLTIANGSIPSGQFGAGANVGFSASLTIENSTFTANTIGSGTSGAGSAVALDANATAVIRNSTFSGNTGEATIFGGGSAALTLVHNTIAGNTGRGQSAGVSAVNGTVNLTNNIIADNSNGVDLFRGAVGNPHPVSGSNNLVQSGSVDGLANTIIANADLAALANNGGPTATRALLAASPAINRAATLSDVTTDQRGVARTQYGGPDVGAYEFNGTVNESLIVTTTIDENNFTSDPTVGAGTSLREAIAYANTRSVPSVITFATALAGQTIPVSIVGGNLSGAFAFNVTSDVTIEGNGVTIRRDDAAAEMRLFNMTSSLTLKDLTVANGRASEAFGFRLGGAIVNSGGQLTVIRSTFLGNSAAEGGAIYHFNSSSSSTFENVTFTANTATTRGAAIAGAGTMNLRHVTIAGNTGEGGALSSDGFGQPVVEMRNTVVSGNTGGDVTVTLAPGSANNYIGGDALLQPLANNGGVTQTMRPATGSPLIDAGAASGVAFDQRGIARPQGTAPDIGAVEVRLPTQTPVLGVTTLSVLSSHPATSLFSLLQATPSGGFFAGPGVSSNFFVASTAGVGVHPITYSFTSADGISVSASATITVVSNATTTTVETSSPDVYGEDHFFTVRVKPVPGWTGRPTGSVQVRVNGTIFYSNMALQDAGDGTSYVNLFIPRLPVPANGQPYVFSATFNSSNGFASSSGQSDLVVTPRPLTLISFNLASKTYDGSTATSISGGFFLGRISGDIVYPDYTNAVATFDNANAGVNKPVTVSGIGLGGESAGNYSFAQPTGLTATISPRAITATGISVAPRVFNGTTTATLDFANAQLQNVLANDAADVSMNTATYAANFDNPNPGQNKPVTVTGLSITGSAAGNYALTRPSGLTGSVSEMSSLIVNTALDTVDVFDGATSLREALRFAEQTSGADTVTFDASMAGQTLTLVDGWNGAADDTAIRVAGELTLQAPMGGIWLVIDAAAPERRHLLVNGGSRLNLNGITLEDGRTVYGGAIYNDGEINLQGVTFRNNRANDLGGAVFNQGTLNLIGCTFDTNTAFQGGAIQSSGTLSIIDSTFQNNSALFNAGALRLFGQATISGSTFNGNTAGNDGGALISFNQLTAVNSTFTDNGATAVVVWTGSADLAHLTVARNRSWGLSINNDSDVTIRNTIIAGNPTGNLYGTPTPTSSGNLLNVTASEARLGELADNGGPTQTIALLPGSPAINAGAVSEVATDQRGFVRPQGGLFDIGAYERLGSNLTMLSSSFEFEMRSAVNFSFDLDASVNFLRENIWITNLTTGQPVPSDVGTLTFDETGQNARLTLTNLLPDADYRLVSFGGSLDFFILAGDANRDRAVNISDFSILASRFNLPGVFSQGDFNYNGTTEIGDFAILAAKFNTSLPALRSAVSSSPASDNRAAPSTLFARVPVSASLFEERDSNGL